MATVFIFSFLLFICYAILIIYYRQAWLSIPGFAMQYRPVAKTRVTVIIPARNEAGNIGRCLNSILNGLYPATLLEVIVVDDHSTDDTATIVKSYSPNTVKLISLKDHVNKEINSYKKKAIEIAVQHSLGELILTTDADCIVPPDWLLTFEAFYQQTDAAFIAAPVAIAPPSVGTGAGEMLIQLFQTLDFMTLQGITGASVHKKIHTMCNGANLAYKRAAFDAVNGFAGIDSIASGDDMLLMYKIYERYPEKVLFLWAKEAIVQTDAVNSIAAFFNQRIRWASKADKYDDKRILPVLALVYLFNASLLVLPIIAIFNNETILIARYPLSVTHFWVLLLLLKTLIELSFLFPVAKFFNKKQLLWSFPLFQPFHILYTVIAGFLGKFGSYKWKERKIR